MIDIIITILIVFFIYYFVSVMRYDSNGLLKKSNKKNNKKRTLKEIEELKKDAYNALPSEAKYFLKKYNIDLDKINLKAFLKLIGFLLGIDIAIICAIVLLIFDDVVFQLVCASVLIIPVYLLTLKFLGSYFKKKGLVKNV